MTLLWRFQVSSCNAWKVLKQLLSLTSSKNPPSSISCFLRFFFYVDHFYSLPQHHNEKQPLLTTTRESLSTATKTQYNQK